MTGDEGAVGEFLEKQLQEAGFTCSRHVVAPDRFNLVATTDRSPRVLLSSHIDTVPPFFPSREERDHLFGRGACDAKGIIAAMICAGEGLLAEGVREFGFLLLVGEETDSIGAKRANQELDLASEYLINGEPTESKFVRASKGALSCTVAFDGVAAHSAYPERGDSAVLKMSAAIQQISSADWGTHPILGKGTANVGVVRGGEKANVIPAHAEMDLIFRTVRKADDVKEQLERLVSSCGGRIVRSHGNDPTWMYAPSEQDSVVVAFNTDVPHLRKFGKPLLFGPGSILDAHGADEKIAKADMKAAVDAYRKLVKDLLAGKVAFHAENE